MMNITQEGSVEVFRKVDFVTRKEEKGGMPGSAWLRDCEVLRTIMSKQVEEKMLYGAICAAAPVVLQPWGLIRRKQTTGHPAFIGTLPTFWAVMPNLQVSGELTTSRGPCTSFEFALSFVEQMLGSSLAEEIGGNLVMIHSDGKHPREEEFNPLECSVEHIPQANILRRAKVDVVVASVEKSMQILGSQESKLVADKSIDDAIILPLALEGEFVIFEPLWTQNPFPESDPWSHAEILSALVPYETYEIPHSFVLFDQELSPIFDVRRFIPAPPAGSSLRLLSAPPTSALQENQTWVSSPQFLLAALLSYLSLTFLLHLILPKTPIYSAPPPSSSPSVLRIISAVHNLFLLISLAMAVGCSLSSSSHWFADCLQQTEEAGDPAMGSQRLDRARAMGRWMTGTGFTRCK
ncbi:hypothetical protein ACLOJK_013754 [Asimina triloba]